MRRFCSGSHVTASTSRWNYIKTRVMMCSYEDLVLDPEKHVRSIYQQVGQVYPKIGITTEVRSNSRKKGKDIELSPEIEHLAQELQDKLEAAYRAKTFQH